MNQSLFLVGEIGGNDYNLPLLERMPLDVVIAFAPIVIAKISSTITVSTQFCCARRFRWHLARIEIRIEFSGADWARSQDSGGSWKSAYWVHPQLHVRIPER
jgi:hypothetical protein